MPLRRGDIVEYHNQHFTRANGSIGVVIAPAREVANEATYHVDWIISLGNLHGAYPEKQRVGLSGFCEHVLTKIGECDGTP